LRRKDTVRRDLISVGRLLKRGVGGERGKADEKGSYYCQADRLLGKTGFCFKVGRVRIYREKRIHLGGESYVSGLVKKTK